MRAARGGPLEAAGIAELLELGLHAVAVARLGRAQLLEQQEAREALGLVESLLKEAKHA